jgi:8-oxo-dGTP diphosphatase
MVDKIFGERLVDKTYYDRVGAYLICLKEDKVAVVKTPKGYFLIGGGLEDNENHIDCIKREVLEETGFSPKVDSYICSAEVYGLHKKLKYFHPIQYYYYGELLNKIVNPVELDHVLQWITTEDIETKMYVKAQGWSIRYFLDNHMKI